MGINEFTSSLYAEMEMKVADIYNAKVNTIQSYRDISSTILKYISRLKAFVLEYHFNDSDEEIHFFKNIKTKFFSKLIFYQKYNVPY